jgi:hypothetical protein
MELEDTPLQLALLTMEVATLKQELAQLSAQVIALRLRMGDG